MPPTFLTRNQVISVFVLAIAAALIAYTQRSPQVDTANMSKSLNVFKQPLSLHSTSPMTGFLRNGYCEVPSSDFGNHAVAAEVTEEFLTFSAAQGNDLRVIPGMKAGCKWCLCASRWLEAFEARGREKDGDKIVPKVWLKATNEKALGKINLEDLKAFAKDAE
ncbi:hypothetical protein TI39_contig4173g00025 [Zymoseptoria brevis]|uniref:Uncharacterized protein n=1 Tax=Zymoseptoria brevis TaxID=1047168 RepID=A0A0F4GBA1_9PEZI|nr:hypothetical protein TI39_contig4173g00025 [Zymoseptoria brevis]